MYTRLTLLLNIIEALVIKNKANIFIVIYNLDMDYNLFPTTRISPRLLCLLRCYHRQYHRLSADLFLQVGLFLRQIPLDTVKKNRQKIENLDHLDSGVIIINYFNK